MKHPAILPKRHPVTKLLVLNAHVEARHVGVQHVLSILRYRYWIMGGAATVKHYIFDCMQCRNRKAAPGAQNMSPLPNVRVEPGQLAFHVCGIDLFGPFFVKVGRSNAKRYGCLFTCLASCVVHLELVESLFTDAFLGAFFRFLCTRGFPLNIYFPIMLLIFMDLFRNCLDSRTKLLTSVVYFAKWLALVSNGILMRRWRSGGEINS